MIEIIRCGHDSRHTKSPDVLHRSGLDHYLFLLIKSDAYVETTHGNVHVGSGFAVLFDKDTRIHYGSLENSYNDDWIHFTVSPDDPILSQAMIPFGTPFAPLAFSDITQYVKLLVTEQYRSSSLKAEIQDALMHALLLKLKEQRGDGLPSANRYYPGFSKLREEIINAPGARWDIPQMAEKLHMSVSYFQHLYKKLFGVSCKKDIILARLSNSKFYLEETDMDISSIAAFCGYEDETYYMKQFKKFEGKTPSQYRQQFLAESACASRGPSF